jgi:hypothetical protein
VGPVLRAPPGVAERARGAGPDGVDDLLHPSTAGREQARLAEQPEFHATLRASLDLYSRAGTQADTSRFAWVKRRPAPTEHHEEERETVVALRAVGDPVGFTAHIKPMFRERDRDSMRFAFDPWSYDEVRVNA